MNIRWKIAQKAELQWWRNYIRKKEPQAYLTWKDNYWIQFLENLDIQPKVNQSVLDVGCGPAGIFRVLKQQHVTALDPLLDKYEASLPVFSRKDHSHCQFVISTFEEYESNQKFDWVFCINAINHVANLKASVEKILQLTEENGRLVLSIDVHRFLFWKYLLRILPTDILHPHQHGLEDYKAMVENAGGMVEQEVCYKKGGLFDYYVLIISKTNGT